MQTNQNSQLLENFILIASRCDGISVLATYYCKIIIYNIFRIILRNTLPCAIQYRYKNSLFNMYVSFFFLIKRFSNILLIKLVCSSRIMTVTSADEFYSIMAVLTREMLEFGLMDANNLINVSINDCRWYQYLNGTAHIAFILLFVLFVCAQKSV
jgi:hypothetical protein